ncbi:hypothetical protein EXT46_07320 [Pseudoalteromonas sp. CO325X]|nr:hypothetical protein EXT46_07320 [Pseudoalteromonas sp. CO325X]
MAFCISFQQVKNATYTDIFTLSYYLITALLSLLGRNKTLDSLLKCLINRLPKFSFLLKNSLLNSLQSSWLLYLIEAAQI